MRSEPTILYADVSKNYTQDQTIAKLEIPASAVKANCVHALLLSTTEVTFSALNK
ncbi:hypothetical protein QCA50_014708 [Cerrena zonata]|uniref:Uncharacterized protein n=1 Tax=Cerrena zonata TaxID=2478898 RepID=A0AAW0FXU0_9APHY